VEDLWWKTLCCAQWPGVHVLSPEDEATAERGFQAAARSSSGLVELNLGGLEFAVRCGGVGFSF
jgi:hypothetical protein